MRQQSNTIFSITALFIGLSLATPICADQTSHGAQLYTRHCSACHGSEGGGGLGVPLSLPDLLDVVDDRYLVMTIRQGRPGRIMPSFDQLSDEEVNAIVKHIRTFRSKKASTISIKRYRHGDARRGKPLYEKHCAGCHGERGEGSAGTGVTFSRPRELPVAAPALNNPGFLAAASDTIIKATLMRGRRGTPMKSFLKQGLSEREIDDIVAYVRSFADDPIVPNTVVNNEPPILVRTSPYSVPETTERVKEVMSRVNMRVIRAVPFNQGIVDPSDEDPRQMIVDGCDFGFLNQALAVDPRIGMFLPCRVTITEKHGKVMVMTINPKRLSSIFNNHKLNEICGEMYTRYNDLLDEVVQ